MGIGARANVDTDVKILRVTCFRPAGPMKKIMPRKSMRRKEKAIGNPDRSRMIKPAIKNIKTAHHSISAFTYVSRFFCNLERFRFSRFSGPRLFFICQQGNEFTEKLQSQEKKAQRDNQKNIALGHINGLDIDHLPDYMVTGSVYAEPAKHPAQAHAHYAVNEGQHFLSLFA
jgi:hypothetical protein